MQKLESAQNNKPKSLYIHVPFCKSKCHYCNFISFAGKNEFIKPYFVALKQELEYYFDKYPDIILQTVYIGGGTPSVVDCSYYDDVFSLLSNFISQNAEMTIEINPGSVDFDYLINIRNLGINRLSIGVQSFDNKILKAINRIHDASEAEKTIKIAKQAGFENISIDLIYGLPHQTINNWEETLYKAINLDIQHISTYGLKIEEDTEFAINPPENIADEELQSIIYLKTTEILANNGFEHYEISNFAKKNKKSLHNLCYWKNKEYIGVGLSAHGYLGKIRYSNTEKLEEYLENPVKQVSEISICEAERIEEAIFLGLRLVEGLDTAKFKAAYGIDIIEKYSIIVKKYVNYGYMAYDNNNLRLTTQGILLSNTILAEFLD